MRGWDKKGKEKVILLFAIVSVISLISPMSIHVSADEIDDLLSKTESTLNPKPSAMVSGYELSPETLMPGDVGVLTITLENMQDKPIERDKNGVKLPEFWGAFAFAGLLPVAYLLLLRIKRKGSGEK